MQCIWWNLRSFSYNQLAKSHLKGNPEQRHQLFPAHRKCANISTGIFYGLCASFSVFVTGCLFLFLGGGVSDKLWALQYSLVKVCFVFGVWGWGVGGIKYELLGVRPCWLTWFLPPKSVKIPKGWLISNSLFCHTCSLVHVMDADCLMPNAHGHMFSWLSNTRF